MRAIACFDSLRAARFVVKAHPPLLPRKVPPAPGQTAGQRPELGTCCAASAITLPRKRASPAPPSAWNMSQPSVSQALQRLEEQLGCQLVFPRQPPLCPDPARRACLSGMCRDPARRRPHRHPKSQERNDEDYGTLSLQIISNPARPCWTRGRGCITSATPRSTFQIEVQNSQEPCAGSVRKRPGWDLPADQAHRRAGLQAAVSRGVRGLLRGRAPPLRHRSGQPPRAAEPCGLHLRHRWHRTGADGDAARGRGPGPADQRLQPQSGGGGG